MNKTQFGDPHSNKSQLHFGGPPSILGHFLKNCFKFHAMQFIASETIYRKEW